MYQTPEALAAYETVLEVLNRWTRRYRVKLWGWLMWHTWGDIYADAMVNDWRSSRVTLTAWTTMSTPTTPPSATRTGSVSGYTGRAAPAQRCPTSKPTRAWPR